jgi:hypothetical protein
VKLWESYERKPVLDKYDLALLLRQVYTLDRGMTPTLDVALLIQLRNALTHFKPEWFDAQQAHARLPSRLTGRFLPSSSFTASEPVFTRRWATHGCTAWAIKSVIDFIETFEGRAERPKRLEQFKLRFLY